MPTPHRQKSDDRRKSLPVTTNGPTSSNSTLIADYVRYKRHDWPSEATRRTRQSQLKQISQAIPELATASEDELLRWSDSLRGTADSVAQYVTVIGGFFFWLTVVRKARLDNPAQILRRPRIPQRQPRPMLDKHYELALACGLSDPEMYLWLGLMGCSGFRCCEVAWMRTHEVEELPDGKGIARVIGKGNKRRGIPIGSMVMLTLRPFLLGSGPVFTHEDGRPWTPKQVSEKTNNFLRGIGVHETAHAMRHRFGTDYHSLDPDMLRQAKIMGHASITTTQLYTELDPLEAAKYIEQLTARRFKHKRAG